MYVFLNVRMYVGPGAWWPSMGVSEVFNIWFPSV